MAAKEEAASRSTIWSRASRKFKLFLSVLIHDNWIERYYGMVHKFAAVSIQAARLEHVWVESSCRCFPRELVSFVRPRELVSFVHPREFVSFVRPRELVSFDPRHVTLSPTMGKRIWVGNVLSQKTLHKVESSSTFHNLHYCNENIARHVLFI